MHPKIFCNWCHFLFSTPKTTRNTVYFNSLRKAKIPFVSCWWITFAYNFQTSDLRKKTTLNCSSMLEGKRKGRWKRPSFQNINMIHAITISSQSQIKNKKSLKKRKGSAMSQWNNFKYKDPGGTLPNFTLICSLNFLTSPLESVDCSQSQSLSTENLPSRYKYLTGFPQGIRPLLLLL